MINWVNLETPQIVPQTKQQKILSRVYAFGSVLCFCGIIAMSKQSSHTPPQLALIKGTSCVIFGYIHSIVTGNELYVRQGTTMKSIFYRGVLAAGVYLSTFYGAKYLKSSTFAVISRTKVYLSLIMNSLFQKENINITLIIFSVVSFIGITLVVDSSVFGLGEDTTQEYPDEDPAMLVSYFQKEMLGILFCFTYVIANSVSKVIECHYNSVMNRSQTFVFLEMYSILCSGFFLVSQPFRPSMLEKETYIILPLLTMMQKWCNSKASEYKIDFTLFVLIQSSIVFFTFLIDVYLFNRHTTIWNLLGGVIVVGSTVLAIFLY